MLQKLGEQAKKKNKAGSSTSRFARAGLAEDEDGDGMIDSDEDDAELRLSSAPREVQPYC